MKRHLKMIQAGLGLLVFVLSFNNCSKVGFSNSTSDPSAKPQNVGDLGIEGIENAEVDRSFCANDDDGDDGDDGNGSCYALCHIPPGNAEAQHTIYVGFPALAAHVGHHISHEDDSIIDHAGECGDEDDGQQSVDDDTVEDGETTDVDAA